MNWEKWFLFVWTIDCNLKSPYLIWRQCNGIGDTLPTSYAHTHTHAASHRIATKASNNNPKQSAAQIKQMYFSFECCMMFISFTRLSIPIISYLLFCLVIMMNSTVVRQQYRPKQKQCHMNNAAMHTTRISTPADNDINYDILKGATASIISE